MKECHKSQLIMSLEQMPLSDAFFLFFVTEIGICFIIIMDKVLERYNPSEWIIGAMVIIMFVILMNYTN